MVKTNGPDSPPALPEVALEVCPEKGFALFGRLIEELDRDLQRMAVPREFLGCDAPGEAGARVMQRFHKAFYCLGSLPSRRRWEHG